MSSPYILLALIVATLVVIVIYFSKSDEDEPSKNPESDNLKNPNQLAIEAPSPHAQIQEMMIRKEEARQKEHEQYMMQVQSAERDRQRDYMTKMRELDQIREQFELKKRELEANPPLNPPLNSPNNTKNSKDEPNNIEATKPKKEDEDDSFDAFMENSKSKK